MTDTALAASMARLATEYGVSVADPFGYAHALIKHLPGQHSQATHGGGGGAGMTVLSADEYAANYEVNDGTAFGGGPGGQGYVYSMSSGEMQIAFENEDGTTSIFHDMGSDEADAIADNIDWARGAVPVSERDLGDRGEDEATGLLDWKASDSAMVGYTADLNIGLASGDRSDVGAKFKLSSRDAGDLETALRTQADEARAAEDVEFEEPE